MNRLFKKLFLSYAAVLTCILLLSLLFIYYQDSSIYRQNRLADYEKDAAERIGYIENELSNVPRIINVLSTTAWVKKRASETTFFDGEFDFFKMQQIQNEMALHYSSSSFFDDVCVLFSNRDQMVGKKGWDTVREYMRSIGIEDRAQQQRLIDTAGSYAPVTWVEFEGDPDGRIIILCSLEALTAPRATAVLVLNRPRIMAYLAKFHHPDLVGFTLDRDIRSKAGQQDGLVRVERLSGKLACRYVASYRMPAYLMGVGEPWVWLIALVVSAFVSTNIAYLLSRATIRQVRRFFVQIPAPPPATAPVTTDDEVRFIQCLKECRPEEVQELMNKWGEDPPAFLYHTLERVMSELGLDADPFRWQRECLSAGAQHILLLETSLYVCERAHYKPTATGQSVYQYVRREWANPALSLKLLGCEFELSDARVSHLFKEYVGVSFQRFLLRIRMERAKALLAQGSDHVAAGVGYENEYSFRRAFLRYEGVAATDYAQGVQAQKAGERLAI